MRPIDADKIVLNYGGLIHISPLDGRAIAKYFYDQIQAMPTIAPPPNDPLTLEQLREMDGEPVWVVQPDDVLPPFWGIVDADDGTVSGFRYCATFEDYDTEWLAYRRKPEDNS